MQSDSKIPVFVFPTSMTFVVEDKSTHKQILSLYNPYDYTVKYRVLSTAPDRYIVNTPEGSIPSHYRADIVIRHNDVKLSNCDIVDKFRIQMQDKINRKVIGKQDVTAMLKSNAQNSHNLSTDRDNFQIIPHSQTVQMSLLPSGHSSQDAASVSSPNYIVLTIAVVCIGGLFLPTEDENDTSSYTKLQISVGLKLIFSYVLGFLTYNNEYPLRPLVQSVINN